jgi:hypothetical protein
MPLNEGAISQILPFCTEGTIAAGDLLSLEDYATFTQRLRGHQKGMALRELHNRALRQISLIAAGLAQYIANRYATGVIDDGDLDKIEAGLVAAIQAQIDGAAPPNASTTVRGIVELATTTETRALESGTLAVTPSGLGAALADALGSISIPADMLRASVSATVTAAYPATALAAAAVEGVVTLDFAARDNHAIAVAAAITFALPTGGVVGNQYYVEATQDATGGHAVTWAAGWIVRQGEWSTDPGAINCLYVTITGGGPVVDIAQAAEV